MTDPYAVPAEMRDFADRSVQQARKAFEGFFGAVKKSTGAMEDATSSSALNVTASASKAVTIAEKNVTAAFDLAEKLVHAKDIQEVMALQSEYLKSQMSAIQEQTRELGEAFAKSMTPGSK
jgi:phasin